MNKYFDMLVARFGPVSCNIVERFGKDYFDGILGWQFPENVLKEYNEAGKLLTMDLDIPGCPCWLDCAYCFAQEDAYYRPQAGDRPLTIGQIKEILKEASFLGLKSAKIIGYREPFQNPRIFDLIEFASERGIQLVLFTALYTFGEKQFGDSREKAIEFLHQHLVSLMVKYHTLDHQKEAMIVKRDEYPKRRDNLLRLLLEHGGFNNESPTRLGIENVIASQNIKELANIYEYFKIWRNVHTDVDSPIPVGRTSTREQSEEIGLTQSELARLYEDIHAVNQKYGLPFWKQSPFIGNAPCSQLRNGLYVTLSGRVATCCGGNEFLGDLNSGDTLQKCFERNPYRFGSGIYHECPYRKRAGILPPV